jgi:signal peptidase I
MSVIVALAATWWFTLAPRAIGGPATIVVVYGTSMEPVFDSGDVVITHRQGRYDIGDVVAFRADGGTVIHRIIDGDPDRGWRTQGDNRATPDGWNVLSADILGKQFLRIPNGLALLTKAGPWLAGIFAFAILAFPSRRRPGRHRKTDAVREISR